MAYNHFYKAVDHQARNLFPSLKDVPEIAWDYLVSPLEIRLPKSVYAHAEEAIRALFALSHRQDYARQLERVPGISDANPKHRSVLMAYDFHTTESGDCYLVEVNTNAAGFWLASLMEVAHSGSPAEDLPAVRALQASFAEEMRLFGGDLATARVAVTDDDIAQQKMYPEFLMFRDWLGRLGAKSELVEARDFVFRDGVLHAPSGPIDLVYNRTTDFYLEDPSHTGLREAFLREAACISPNPKEYWLLADKQRLVQWSQKDFMALATAEEAEAIGKVLIPTYEKSHFASTDDVWSNRKTLFFKPKRSYGGKSVYRGESVSRKVFERLMSEDILIQKYQPPARFPTDDPNSVMNNWKYDLRFYVYADQIQLVAARIYQGQVTNFSSPMGGFTRVAFA